MAKKTIISDFSALKGKISFSEKSTDTKMPPKVTPAISLGKTVRIELEDASLKDSNSSSRWRPSEESSERTFIIEE